MNRNRLYLLCAIVLTICLGGIVAGAIMTQQGCHYKSSYSVDCETTSFDFDVSDKILTVYLAYNCENPFNNSLPRQSYTWSYSCIYPKTALMCLQDKRDTFLPLGTHWSGYSHTEECCYEPYKPKDPVDADICGGGIAFLCVFISTAVITFFIMLTADQCYRCCCFIVEDRQDLLETRPQ